MPVVLTGGPEETALTRRVARAMTGRAIDLAGRTTLGALAVLLSNARLLICGDTGISHLAAALHVPSVVVFTGSDPLRWAPLDAAIHKAVVPDADPECGRGRATREGAGRLPATEKVIAAAEELLLRERTGWQRR
jgi:ADP-heptose:LPS heptosyltransferase